MTTPTEVPEDESDGALETPTPSPGDGRKPLTSAGALDERRAHSVTSAAESRIIVISGLAGSGKTTLLTSIYERLHMGPLGALHFAGGSSAHAFEESCHEGRLASDRETPETPRTPHTSPGECRFLHLRLATTDNPGSINAGADSWHYRDLLFTDLQGEVFERVRDDSDAAARMPVFQRADHFVQLLDGDFLREDAKRQVTVADAKSILRSCLAGNVLTQRTIVHVVATKWDLVRSAGNEPAVNAFFNSASDSIGAILRGHVADVRRHVTAARSSFASPIESWGVMSLVSQCYFDSAQVAGSPVLKRLELTNEFDRFASKTGIE